MRTVEPPRTYAAAAAGFDAGLTRQGPVLQRRLSRRASAPRRADRRIPGAPLPNLRRGDFRLPRSPLPEPVAAETAREAQSARVAVDLERARTNRSASLTPFRLRRPRPRTSMARSSGSIRPRAGRTRFRRERRFFSSLSVSEQEAQGQAVDTRRPTGSRKFGSPQGPASFGFAPSSTSGA